MTAHHAVLVMQVTDVERHNDELPQIDNYGELPDIVQSLADLLGPTDPEMVTETYWRATHYMSESSAQYASGKLTLAQKALAEQSYFAICRRLYNQLRLVSARTAQCSTSSTTSWRTSTSVISRCSRACPIPGRSTRSCRSSLQRLTEEPVARRAAGPDLRLGRQDQALRRRAEHREQHAGARGRALARSISSGCSSGPIRKFSATCTTCSAIPIR